MTNIFHKKDGLADAVKSVMEVNQFHREAEAQVNEMFGVVSRKALPHEQQASWDAEFNKIISEGAMKRMSMGDDGGMETYKKKPEGYSPKGMKMAKKDYDGDGKIETSTDEWKGSRDKAIKKSMAMDEEEQIDELKGYQGRRGQKLLYKVHARAFKRLDKAIDKKDTKTVRKNSEIMSNAWDRMKDVYEEEQIDEMDALDKKRMTSTAAQVNKAGKSDSAPEIRKAAGAMQRSRVNIDKASDRLDRGGEMSGPTPKKVAIEEKVKNKYAIGMAAAMKSTGDEPPLKKSTIKKAHEIAKKIGESAETESAFNSGMKDAEKKSENEKKKNKAIKKKKQRIQGPGGLYKNITKVYGESKQAKELAEESLDSIQEEIATNLYAELNYVMEQHGEEAGDEWIANLSEEQLAIMEGFMDYLKSKFGTQSMRKDVEKKYGGEKPTLSGSIGGSAARKAEKDRLAMGAREAGTYGKEYDKPTAKPKPTAPTNSGRPDSPRPDVAPGGQVPSKVPGSVVRPKPPKPAAPAEKAPAPAPVKKAKPAAPKPTFKANFKGGFGQRATQDTGPQKRGSDR